MSLIFLIVHILYARKKGCDVLLRIKITKLHLMITLSFHSTYISSYKLLVKSNEPVSRKIKVGMCEPAAMRKNLVHDSRSLLFMLFLFCCSCVALFFGSFLNQVHITDISYLFYLFFWLCSYNIFVAIDYCEFVVDVTMFSLICWKFMLKLVSLGNIWS